MASGYSCDISADNSLRMISSSKLRHELMEANGMPSVLLIHGVASDERWCQGVAELLRPNFKCGRVRYPHYRHIGRIGLVLEVWALVVGGGLLVAGMLRKGPLSPTLILGAVVVVGIT